MVDLPRVSNSMEGKENLSESETQEEVYKSRMHYITYILAALFLISVGFLLNFPVEQKAKAAIVSALKKNKVCRVDYAKFELDLFLLPELNFKDLVLPGRCFGNPRAALYFESVDIKIQRPTVLPVGILTEVTVKQEQTKLNIFTSFGISSANIRIEKSTIDSSLIALVSRLPLKLNGVLNIDAILETNYEFPTVGEFHITSNNLGLPPQRIIILDIKNISLSPMILKGDLKNDIVSIQRFQVGNSTTKLELIITDGTIELSKTNPNRHLVDLEGRIRFSEDFIKEFPILVPFLGSARLDGNGFYRVSLKGPSGNLVPKFL